MQNLAFVAFACFVAYGLFVLVMVAAIKSQDHTPQGNGYD